MTTALDTLIASCSRRALGLWRKRWQTVDRADTEQNLALACADALRRYRPGRHATLETFAISLFKALCAREQGQMRYGVELDNDAEIIDADERRLTPEGYLYRWWPEVYAPATALDALDERHIRHRLGVLPPTLRQFAQLVVDDALGCAEAGELLGVGERQGRYNIEQAVRLLEQSGGAVQFDLFDELEPV
jgi:DNA-directed RNA polymerase specialized sigma24 family protein